MNEDQRRRLIGNDIGIFLRDRLAFDSSTYIIILFSAGIFFYDSYVEGAWDHDEVRCLLWSMSLFVLSSFVISQKFYEMRYITETVKAILNLNTGTLLALSKYGPSLSSSSGNGNT